MSNKVAIVTDSTSYLPKECIDQYHISIIPLSVVWGDQVLLDGVDVQPAEYYERLSKSKVMPTTSQVTPAAMLGTFQPLLEQGYDVLSIFISSKFSGTIQSAMQARDMLDGAASRLAIVDSLSTTMAMGWPVLTAARAAQAGESLSECRTVAENACKNSGVLFVVETLEFLRRGGRIGGASALLGTALNIKPVLEMRDGRIESVEKIRTKHKAIQRMLDLATERINGRTPVRVAVTHANAEADASSLLQQASDRFNPVETIISPLSPVIGTHAGPGTVALNFMAGN
ncbi:MAG: DegV family protein [Anaerolineales bacterium]